MTRRTVTVTGMQSSSCGSLIDEALEELPGVASASTDLRRETTTVEYTRPRPAWRRSPPRSPSWATGPDLPEPGGTCRAAGEWRPEEGAFGRSSRYRGTVGRIPAANGEATGTGSYIV